MPNPATQKVNNLNYGAYPPQTNPTQGSYNSSLQALRQATANNRVQSNPAQNIQYQQPQQSPQVSQNQQYQQNPVLNSPSLPIQNFYTPSDPQTSNVLPTYPQSVYSQSQPDFTPSPTKTTQKKKLSLVNLSGYLGVFVLFLISAVLITVIVGPGLPSSKFLLQNTFLGDFIKTDSEATSSLSKKDTDYATGKPNSNNSALNFVSVEKTKPVTDIVQEVLPSILSINIQTVSENIAEVKDVTAGTGYVVSEDGLVFTNKHVVSVVCKPGVGNLDIIATTHEDKLLNLDLLSVDPLEDIAILKIRNYDNSLPAVKMADSNDLVLGQEVVAIGNVLGELPNTVTRGIVSGVNRSFSTALKDECTDTNFQADGLIQTDAAINRGNSGGPLFNPAGQLIGMNTLGSTEAQNIGFALPTRTLSHVLNIFKSKSKITRARLGIKTLTIDKVSKSQNVWLPRDYGEIIFTPDGQSIDPDSKAAKAGVSEGDIILSVDGIELRSGNGNPQPLRKAILSKKPGEKIVLQILKAKTASKNSYTYVSDTKEISFELGSITYDLQNDKLLFE